MDMYQQPLISIIIPVYNRKIELIRCLSSVSNQIFSENFEVVVVNDGSTQNLDHIINNFQNKLNLSYIKINNSGGPARPRNIGAKNSKGRWISFLDCDDAWDTNRLLEISKHLSLFREGILYHKLKVINEKFFFIPFYKNNVGSRIYLNPLDQFMKCGNPIPNSSVVIDRKSFFSLGGFDESEEIRAYEDFDLWIRAAKKKLNFLYIDKQLGSYYVSSDSISKVSIQIINRQKFFYKKHHLKNFSLDSKSKIQSYRRYNLGTLYMNNFDYKKRALVLLKNANDLYAFKNKLSRAIKIIRLNFNTKIKTGL